MTLAVQGLAKKLALVFSMSLFLYRQRGRDWNWPCSSARLPFCPGISRQGGGGRETGPGVQRVYLSVQVSPGKGELAETETGPGVQRVSLSVQVSPGKGEMAEKLALVFRMSPFLSRYLPTRDWRWQRNWPWSSACPSCTYCASLDPRTGLPANRCDPRSHVVSGRSAMCPPRT